MKYRFTIGAKLTLGIGALILSLLLLGGASLHAVSTLGTSLDLAVNRTAKKLERLGGVQQAFQELKGVSLRQQISYAILELDHRSVANNSQTQNKGMACSSCHEPAAVNESKTQIEAAADLVHRQIRDLLPLVNDTASASALNVMDNGASNWLSDGQQYLLLADHKEFDKAHAVLRDKMLPILGAVDSAAKDLSQREQAALVVSHEQALRDISKNRWTAFILIGLNLIIAIGAVFLVQKVTRTLRQEVDAMTEAVEQVVESANQVRAGSESLAAGASKQAASIEETSASSQEINAMTQRNSENCQLAAAKMMEAAQRVGEANRTLAEMVAGMVEINDSSAKIAKIMRVIDEIAFQTNILALNAAVEAARAGESGLGFAVVAAEVRNLAERSAQAARDTSTLIEESNSKSIAGRDKLDHVSVAMRSMAESALNVKELVDQVHGASKEQSLGIQQIASSIAQIEHITQATAASAEQNSAASEELTAQTTAINRVVQGLRSLL